MKQINTFAEYQKLIDAGYTPDEAAAQIDVAFSIYHGHEPLTREYLDKKMDHIENRMSHFAKDISYIHLMLGAIFTVGFIPIIKQLFGLV